jgi:putative colanic acid biosynthesis acetyltransferase WcaF
MRRDPKPTVETRAIDIAANRKAPKWPPAELLGRALWEISRGPLFAWTPRPFWAWRRAVLRAFGAKIGRNVHVYPSVRIAVPWNLRVEDNAAVGDRAIIYNLGLISIGRDATISQYAHLCAGTHDFRLADMPLLKQPITIGAGAWVCADAFVGPGVSFGPTAVIGARAVVVRDVAENMIVVGNPARIVGERGAMEPE